MSVLLSLSVCIIASAGYFFGRDIGLEDGWAYFESLRTTSSIVFGVMAALLAIVYPEVIKQGFRAPKNDSSISIVNLHHIVDPLAQSAVLLVLLVILGPIYAWVQNSFAGSTYAQGGAFALLSALSAWQVWILVLVLRPLDLLRSHTDENAAKQQIRRRIHSNIEHK
jgi:hypothetical protein